MDNIWDRANYFLLRLLLVINFSCSKNGPRFMQKWTARIRLSVISRRKKKPLDIKLLGKNDGVCGGRVGVNVSRCDHISLSISMKFSKIKRKVKLKQSWEQKYTEFCNNFKSNKIHK